MAISAIARPVLAGASVLIIVVAGASLGAFSSSPVGAAVTATTAPDGGGEAFTRCMRSKGLPDFPRATVDADGRVFLDLNGRRFDPFSREYRRALQACRSHLPDPIGLPGKPVPPPEVAEIPRSQRPAAPKAPAAPKPPAAPR